MRTSTVSDTDEYDVDHHKAFAVLILNHQDKLKAYISFVVSDRSYVSDILQEVNLTLLDKEYDYDFERNFFSWACGIAKMKILSYFRDRKREKITFDSELISLLTLDSEKTIGSEYDLRREKLEKCLSHLSSEQNRLLWMHYGENYTIEEIAEIYQKKHHTIRQMLYRIRKILARCMDQSN